MQLGLLDFEQPPCVAPKLAELCPFPDIGAPARRDSRAVIPVHGVNAGLEPVMLGAQADEGRLLQAPRVEAWLQPFSGRRGAFRPSRSEGLDLLLDGASKPAADAHRQGGEPGDAKGQSLGELMAKAPRSWPKPRHSA